MILQGTSCKLTQCLRFNFARNLSSNAGLNSMRHSRTILPGHIIFERLQSTQARQLKPALQRNEMHASKISWNPTIRSLAARSTPTLLYQNGRSRVADMSIRLIVSLSCFAYAGFRACQVNFIIYSQPANHESRFFHLSLESARADASRAESCHVPCRCVHDQCRSFREHKKTQVCEIDHRDPTIYTSTRAAHVKATVVTNHPYWPEITHSFLPRYLTHTPIRDPG